MDNIIWIFLFVAILLFIEIGYYAFKVIWNPEKREVQKRLKFLSTMDYKEGETDISKKRLLSNVSWLQRLLRQFPVTDKLALFLERSGVRWNVGLVFLSSLTLAAVGFLIGSYLTRQHQMIYYGYILSVLFAIFFGLFPFFLYFAEKELSDGKV